MSPYRGGCCIPAKRCIGRSWQLWGGQLGRVIWSALRYISFYRHGVLGLFDSLVAAFVGVEEKQDETTVTTHDEGEDNGMSASNLRLKAHS